MFMARFILSLVLLITSSQLLIAETTKTVLVNEEFSLGAHYSSYYFANFHVDVFDGPFIVSYTSESRCSIIAKEEGTFKITTTSQYYKKRTLAQSFNYIYSDPIWYYDDYIIKVVDLHAIVIPSSMSLTVGSEYQFNPTFVPDIIQVPVSWNSSNPSIVSIDETGLAKALSPGVVTVTCVAPNGVYATCTITVNSVPVVGISIPSAITLYKNDTYTFSPVLVPSNANGKLSWTSSNSNVVSVDSSGTINAVDFGMATITCHAESGVTANCIVTVAPIAITSISMQSELSLHYGDTYALETTISPPDSQMGVSWKTSDASIATISNAGLVSAVGVGIATVSCIAENGIKAECHVTVEPYYVSSLSMSLSKCWITETDSVFLQPVIQPDNATVKKLQWSSSDPAVAGVNSKGRVTAHKAGRCVITVAATDGSGVSAQCDVRVVARGDGVMPMLHSVWSQGTPFDIDCPTGADGTTLPPGSAAVALGQILNFHRTLSSGFGHVTYANTLADGTTTGNIDINFDNMKLEWDNVLDQYNFGYYKRSTNGKAVASLLAQTGAALMMMYRPEGSIAPYDGAALWGLHHHLHLAANSVKRYRADYTTAEWTAMIDNELDNGRPVFYGGARFNPVNREMEDYAFVIDGRNTVGGTTYYHANFGDGLSPKYVTLETLNQSGSMPGGFGKCWHLSQWMYFKAKPAKADTYPEVGLISCRPLIVNDNPASVTDEVPVGGLFRLQYTMGLYGNKKTAMEYALGYFQKNELKAVSYPSTNATEAGTAVGSKSMPVGEEKVYRHYYDVPAGLASGTYAARLIARAKGGDEWERWIEIAPSSLTVTVSNGKAVITRLVNRRDPSATISLDSDIAVVTNDFESVQPGTALRFNLHGDDAVNFQDTIKVKITIPGESAKRTFKTIAAVYVGTTPVYDILIPDQMLNLKGVSASFKAYYYDRATGEYMELTTEQPYIELEDVNSDGNVDVGDVNTILTAILNNDNTPQFDVNNDNNVDVGDVNTVLAIILSH